MGAKDVQFTVRLYPAMPVTAFRLCQRVFCSHIVGNQMEAERLGIGDQPHAGPGSYLNVTESLFLLA